MFERLDEKNRGFVTIDQLYDIIPVEAVEFVTPTDVQSMCREVWCLDDDFVPLRNRFLHLLSMTIIRLAQILVAPSTWSSLRECLRARSCRVVVVWKIHCKGTKGEPPMAFDPFPAYFRFVRRFRFLIVLVWLGMIGIGVWRAPKLFDNLKVWLGFGM